MMESNASTCLQSTSCVQKPPQFDSIALQTAEDGVTSSSPSVSSS